MKIVFVTPYFSPSVGGVQQYVSDLIDAYSKSHEIVVVTTQLDKTQSMHEVIDGVTIYRLPVLCKIANTPYHPSWKRHLRSIYAREKPDVINAHAPVPWLADVAERANNDAIPFVVTYHSGSMKKGSLVTDGIIGAYERFVLPKTIRSATRVVAIYPDFIRRLVGENHPIAHITPGIDTEFFHINDVDMQYDMLFAGRLEKSSAWKGLDVALRAVAELVKKGQNVTFAIVGDGDARAKYEQLSAQLGIDNHVVFLGPLTHSELTKTYSVSKLIVLPSTTESESFGMVVAEAASCGVPAIGSNIGGIPYVINDHTTGLLVEPGNHTAFATAISQLLTDDQLRERYGKAARKRVVELFSKNKMSELTLKAFQEAAHQQYPKTLQVVAYYPPALGGMERVAENIAIELAETGTPTEVVTSDIGHTPGYVDQAKPNYTVTRLRSAMIGGLPIIPSLLLHLLRQPKKSLYHVHIAQAFIPEIAFLAARIRRGKFVAHFHLDVVASGTFGFVFRLYKRTLFPQMLRRADKVLVFSEDQKKLVVEKYHVHADKVAILPNGIRRGFERAEPRTLHQPTRLLFVGRLSHQKNIAHLLASLEGISDQFVTRIVGDGELRSKLEQQARELNLKNVTFAGRKDDDELRDEYDAADIFVLPSEREGMPLVLIDAMAMRLPAVGTDVLGIRDMIDDGTNGLLAPLDDATKFREHLLSLAASSEQYARMSQDAYASVRELTWPHLTRRLVEEVYT